jgi:hypothetical protein
MEDLDDVSAAAGSGSSVRGAPATHDDFFASELFTARDSAGFFVFLLAGAAVLLALVSVTATVHFGGRDGWEASRSSLSLSLLLLSAPLLLLPELCTAFERCEADVLTRF